MEPRNSTVKPISGRNIYISTGPPWQRKNLILPEIRGRPRPHIAKNVTNSVNIESINVFGIDSNSEHSARERIYSIFIGKGDPSENVKNIIVGCHKKKSLRLEDDNIVQESVNSLIRPCVTADTDNKEDLLPCKKSSGYSNKYGNRLKDFSSLTSCDYSENSRLESVGGESEIICYKDCNYDAPLTPISSLNSISKGIEDEPTSLSKLYSGKQSLQNDSTPKLADAVSIPEVEVPTYSARESTLSVHDVQESKEGTIEVEKPIEASGHEECESNQPPNRNKLDKLSRMRNRLKLIMHVKAIDQIDTAFTKGTYGYGNEQECSIECDYVQQTQDDQGLSNLIKPQYGEGSLIRIGETSIQTDRENTASCKPCSSISRNFNSSLSRIDKKYGRIESILNSLERSSLSSEDRISKTPTESPGEAHTCSHSGQPSRIMNSRGYYRLSDKIPNLWIKYREIPVVRKNDIYFKDVNFPSLWSVNSLALRAAKLP